MRNWFMDPDFTANVGTARTYEQPGSYWYGPEFHRLDAAVGGIFNASRSDLTAPRAMLVELGFDGAELFHFTTHSTQIMAMR